jgi:PB1 domain
MNAMSAESSGQPADVEGGPMWGRFFDSIGQDDTESVMSGSHALASRSSQHIIPQSPHSEVHPDDSASVGDDASVLEGRQRKAGLSGVPSIVGPVTVPVEDGTYVFKFRTPSGRTHRFQSRHDDVEHLRDIVSGKLSTDPFFVDWVPANESDIRPDPLDFHVSYTDADGDNVVITSDHDVSDSVKIARAAGHDRVVLVVEGVKGWNDVPGKRIEATAVEVPAVSPPEVKEIEKVDSSPVIPASVPVAANIHPTSEEVMGIPKDLILPASIGALAVVIIGVFTISRLASSSRW